MIFNTKRRLYHLPAKLEIGTLTVYSSVIEHPNKIMEFQYDQYEKFEDNISFTTSNIPFDHLMLPADETGNFISRSKGQSTRHFAVKLLMR